MTLLRFPRSAAAEIFLLLAEHDAHAADTDLGDFDVAEFLDATEQVERGCRIFHRRCARANFSGRACSDAAQAPTYTSRRWKSMASA